MPIPTIPNLLMVRGPSGPPPAPMVLVFDTSLGDLTVEVPLAGTVDCTIDWGDGTSDSYTTTGTKTHTYASGGEYTVEISGTLTRFGGFVSRPELTKCLSFGNIGLTSLELAFARCANFNQAPTSLPPEVESLRTAFYECAIFNQNISNWDVSNIKNIENLFSFCSTFNQNIGGWDVSNVTSTNSVFNYALAFNQDISGWDVSNVKSTSFMFRRADSFNQDISGWDVSNVVGPSDNMFQGAVSFNQDLSSWVTGLAINPSSFSTGATAWTNPAWRPFLSDGVTQITT